MSHAIGVKKIQRLTRLGEFIGEHELKPNRVADLTGISREHFRKLCCGKSEPTRKVMIWIALACGRLLDRRVRVVELFDLGDGE